MKRGPQSARIGYFGKLPARGDFIKAADNPALAALLDGWLAEVMNRLSTAPRWKLHYDALRPLRFAFVGTRSRRAIAGHLAASSDASRRRYPFLAMSAIDVEAPQGFVSLSPLVLAPLWNALDVLTADVLSAADPEPSLQAMASTTVPVDPGAAEHETAFTDFLDRHNISGLEALLGRASVRRTILAVGLLLQPVRRSGTARLDKSLLLPLPQGPRERYLVAALWLDLVAPFLQRADFELALFLAEVYDQPALVIGFGGAAPEALQAIIDPECAADQQVDFDDTGWVDDLVAGDAAVQKLSAYLEQGQLSLRSVRELFHETFV
ncbi:MAG: type VI secretion system-associated protein TagF [Duganella sp.]